MNNGHRQQIGKNTANIDNLHKAFKEVKRHLWALHFSLWGLILILVATGVVQLEDITKYIARLL